MNLNAHGRSKQLRRYYQCRNHRGNSCVTKPINAKYIESAVLDLVVKIIEQSDLSIDIEKAIKVDDSFNKSLITKNQNHLKLLNEKFCALTIKSMDPSLTKVVIDTINTQINSLANEIQTYTEIIANQEQELTAKKVTDYKVTKAELESNRLMARSIIKSIVDEIVYDESTGEISIILL